MNDRCVLVLSLPFLLAFLLVGCVNLSREFPEIQFYTLDPSVDVAVGDSPSKITPSAMSLVISPFTISPLHAEADFLLRRDGSRVERDFYNRFVIPPVTLIESETASWMSASGLFDDVRTNLDAGRHDWQLGGNVMRMEGDFAAENPVAVLTIQFHLRPGPGRDAPRFFRTYNQQIPITSSTAASLSEGWNRAFAAILSNLEADLAEHLESQ